MDRNMIDAASCGALGNITPATARQLIENMASNSQQFGTRSDAIVIRGVHDVGAAEYTKKLESKIDALTSLVNQLASNQRAPVARVCGLCTFVDHFTDSFQHCNNRLLLLLFLHQWIPLRPMQQIFSTTIGPNINNRTMICQQTDIIQDGGITLI